MPKPFQPQVITANDLIEGDVVFLGRAGWTRRIAEARVGTAPEEAEALMAEAARAEAANRVVGVYAVTVDISVGTPWPTARREQIRASRAPTVAVGPAARPDRRAAA